MRGWVGVLASGKYPCTLPVTMHAAHSGANNIELCQISIVGKKHRPSCAVSTSVPAGAFSQCVSASTCTANTPCHSWLLVVIMVTATCMGALGSRFVPPQQSLFDNQLLACANQCTLLYTCGQGSPFIQLQCPAPGAGTCCTRHGAACTTLAVHMYTSSESLAQHCCLKAALPKHWEQTNTTTCICLHECRIIATSRPVAQIT